LKGLQDSKVEARRANTAAGKGQANQVVLRMLPGGRCLLARRLGRWRIGGEKTGRLATNDNLLQLGT
jgi:hypothetical protein